MKSSSRFWAYFTFGLSTTILLAFALSTLKLNVIFTPTLQLTNVKTMGSFSITQTQGIISFRTDEGVLMEKDRLLIPIQISSLTNLFETKTLLKNIKLMGQFHSEKTSSPVKIISEIRPNYRGYANDHEINQEVFGHLAISPLLEKPTGHYQLNYEHSGQKSEIQFDVIRPVSAGFKKVLDLIPTHLWGWIPVVLQGIVLTLFGLNLAGSLFQVRSYLIKPSALVTPLQGRLFLLAGVFLVAECVAGLFQFSTLKATSILLSLAIVVVLAFVSKKLFSMKTFVKLIPGKFIQILAYVFMGTILVLFVYFMKINPSFRWSVFEERDFLTASEVGRFLNFPVLGPQLLAGGQTPGGSLYLILAPFLKIWSSPVALSYLTKVLFLGSAVFLGFILKRYVGLVAALFGVLFFCASNVVMALSYWPIHPNMSIFIFYTFLYFLLRFYVEKHQTSFVFASIGLSILLQFHITYSLLLIPYGILIFGSEIENKRKLLIKGALSFLVLLIPYFIHEFLTGFDNFKQILMAPRYHPHYVLQVPLMTNRIMSILKEWLVGGWTLTESRTFEWVFVACVFLCAGIIAYAEAALENLKTLTNTRKQRIARSFLLFFGIPFTILALAGAGYSFRHIISFAPVLFLTLGVGAQKLWDFNKSYFKVPLVVIFFVFGTSYAQSILNKENALRLSGSVGEWAVDYDSREKVAQYLISELHVSPEQYAKQVYWWWMGWSMAPEVYQKQYSKTYSEIKPSKLSDNKTLFLLGGEPGKVFTSLYELKKLQDVSGITIYEATPKVSLPVIANTRNIERMSKKEALIEQFRAPPAPSATHLISKNSNPNQQVYFLSLHESRLKLLITLKPTEKGVLWKLESPAFSGYYQEIKTLWEPKLIFTYSKNANQKKIVPVAWKLLGDLFNKTPMEGHISLDHPLNEYSVQFEVQGWFDQSNMHQPELTSVLLDLTGSKSFEAQSEKFFQPGP